MERLGEGKTLCPHSPVVDTLPRTLQEFSIDLSTASRTVKPLIAPHGGQAEVKGKTHRVSAEFGPLLPSLHFKKMGSLVYWVLFYLSGLQFHFGLGC